MMNFSDFPVFIQAFFGAAGAFALTVLGAALVFFVNGENRKSKKAFDGFSAGVMLSAAFFSLLLPALEVPARGSAWLVSGGFFGGAALVSLVNLLFLKRGDNAGGVGLLYVHSGGG